MNEKVLLAVQEDVLAKLLSEAELSTVPGVLQRKLLTSASTPIPFLWMTERNGKIGTGYLVQMPHIEADVKETGIGDCTLVVPIITFEMPNLAQAAVNGSRMTSEEIALIIRRLMRGFVLDGILSFFTEGNSIEPTAFEDENGKLSDLVSYVVNIKGRFRSPSDSRVGTPTISETSLSVTLANATGFSAANIYYTADGSFPGTGNAGIQGGNIVANGAVYDSHGHYAAATAAGARYIITDAVGAVTVITASGSTYALAGAAGTAVTQAFHMAAVQPYSAPFTVTSGTVVRFAAYLSGYSGSIAVNRTII